MQLNGDQPPQTEPTCHTHVSKTHCNAERVAEISLLDVEEKGIENMFILARNRKKSKVRAKRLTDPEVAEPSDDESVITVASRPGTPPSTPPRTPLPTLQDTALASLGSAIQSLSPRSLIQSILGKRALDAEESREERIKRLKMASAPEIKRAPGQVLILPHKTELLELEVAGMYMPLTLFTRTGELILADHLDDVRTIRRNSKPGEKRNLYIDINDKRFEKELDLSQEAWTFASDEMVEWARDAKSDDRLHIRLGQHFGWLKYQLADGRDFSLVRELDIKLRKEYRRQPFEFSGDIYSEELRNLSVKHLESRMAAEMALLRSQPPSHVGLSRSAFSEPPSSRGRARGFGRSSQSFQPGQARPPSDPVCLICARRGHRIDTCTFKTLPGGSPVKTRAVDGSPIEPNGKPCCISWNTNGRESTRCTPHRKPDMQHICTFCLSPTHHAFSFSCQPNPS